MSFWIGVLDFFLALSNQFNVRIFLQTLETKIRILGEWRVWEREGSTRCSEN